MDLIQNLKPCKDIIMDKFKEYCRIRSNIKTYEQNEEKIDNFLFETKNEIISFSIFTVLAAGFIFIFFCLFLNLIFFIDDFSEAFFSFVFIILNLIFSFLYFFNFYIDKFYDFKTPKRDSYKYKLPIKKIEALRFWKAYRKDKCLFKSLESKVKTKVNLDKIFSKSDYLTLEEFKTLEFLIDEDKKERIKIKNSVISTY